MSEDEQEAQAGPVVKVARDLTEIVRLYDDLESEAIAHGDNPDIPGGAAMIALAGVANYEAWEHQLSTTERLGLAYTSVEDEDPDESWPPFQYLSWWSEAWRREHDADYDSARDIRTEANFLRAMLDWAWDNEPHWDDFASDIRRARVKLENILTAGNRVDRSRVVCDRCEESPRLLCLPGADDGEDRWKCPVCKVRFDHAALLRAHAKQLRHESAAKYLPKQDAVLTLATQGRAARTVRKWLEPSVQHVADVCSLCGRTWPPQEHSVCPSVVIAAGGKEACGGELMPLRRGDPEDVIEGYCDVRTRRTFVFWPSLWRKHLTTQSRRRRESA